jgi:hypothetical protein
MQYFLVTSEDYLLIVISLVDFLFLHTLGDNSYILIAWKLTNIYLGTKNVGLEVCLLEKVL